MAGLPATNVASSQVWTAPAPSIQLYHSEGRDSASTTNHRRAFAGTSQRI